MKKNFKLTPSEISHKLKMPSPTLNTLQKIKIFKGNNLTFPIKASENNNNEKTETPTLMETIKHKWDVSGYKMPKLIFWNVNAASGGGNIPMKDEDGVTFVSGASPSIFTSILTGKTGQDLMMETLMTPRYEQIISISDPSR